MRSEQEIRIQPAKNSPALTPRRGFDTGRLIARKLDAMDAQIDRMGGAESGAEISPIVGMGRKAVMNVNGPQGERVARAQLQQNVQQDNRIEPARQGKHQAGLRLDMARKAGRRRNDRFTWQEFP